MSSSVFILSDNNIPDASEMRFGIVCAEWNNNITFNELRNDAIAMASCKMSIKANQVLTDVEMKKVISDLYECKNPFTCPHGRPIITKMEKKDLEKMFKRIV